MGRYSVFTIHDHGEGLTVIRLLEWWLATYQHEQNHPETPDVWGKRDQTETTEYMIKPYLIITEISIQYEGGSQTLCYVRFGL